MNDKLSNDKSEEKPSGETRSPIKSFELIPPPPPMNDGTDLSMDPIPAPPIPHLQETDNSFSPIPVPPPERPPQPSQPPEPAPPSAPPSEDGGK